MRTRRAVLTTGLSLSGLSVVGLVALAGCGAPGVEVDSDDPTPSAGPTPRGMRLTDAGYTHAPAGFTIPGEVSITRRVDQPNVVTALFSAADGRVVLAHLSAELPAMGFTIDRSGSESLLFSNDVWDGAFTISPELSGLTLRRRPR